MVILSFVLYWAILSAPCSTIFDSTWYALPVGLQILKQLDATNWPYSWPGRCSCNLPVILMFGILQRFFLSNTTWLTFFDRVKPMKRYLIVLLLVMLAPLWLAGC